MTAPFDRTKNLSNLKNIMTKIIDREIHILNYYTGPETSTENFWMFYFKT